MARPSYQESRCILYGTEPLSELFVDIQGGAFIQTPAGRHEFSCLRYVDSVFHLGHGPNQAGPGRTDPKVDSVEFEPEGKGLTIHLAGGYVTRVPAARLQGTWRCIPLKPDAAGAYPRNPLTR